MKVKNIFFIVALFVAGFATGWFYYGYLQNLDREQTIGVKGMNDSDIPIDELKRITIHKGDGMAYLKLNIASMNNKFYPADMLSYSLIMANKYNNSQAYYDVYHFLTQINRQVFNGEEYIDSLNTELQKMAIEYLQKAADTGNKQAKDELEDY